MPDNECRAAIRRVWPEELWPQAYVVTHLENGKAKPALKVRNRDKYRSWDRGCWMINDHWHPQVSDAQSFDPDFSARYALGLYQANVQRHRSGWSSWYAVRGKYWR